MFFHGWLVGFGFLLAAQLVAAKTTEVYAVNGTFSSAYFKNATACNGWGYVETTLFGDGFEQIFSGTRAQWLFVESNDGAALEVYQDGAFIGKKTTFSSTVRLDACEYVVYDTGNLTMGTHNITMYHAGVDVLSTFTSIPALRSIGVIVTDPFEDPTSTSSVAGGKATSTGTGTAKATSAGTGTAIPSNDDTKSINPGIIVGGVVGGIVAFAAMGLIIFLCFRRKRPSKSHPPAPVNQPMAMQATYNQQVSNPPPAAPYAAVPTQQQAFMNGGGDPFSPNSNQHYAPSHIAPNPAYAAPNHAPPPQVYNNNTPQNPFSPVPPSATTMSSYDSWNRPEPMNPYNYNNTSGAPPAQMSNQTVSSTTPLTYR